MIYIISIKININISVINDVYVKLFIGIITVLKTLSGYCSFIR